MDISATTAQNHKEFVPITKILQDQQIMYR